MKTHEEEEEVDVDSITVSLFVNVLENPNLTMKQAGSSQVIIFFRKVRYFTLFVLLKLGMESPFAFWNKGNNIKRSERTF